MKSSPREFEVADDAGRRRLDLFLAEKLALSRAQVRRLLERGAVRVGGVKVAASAKGIPLATGTRVEVEPFTRPEEQRSIAEGDVRFEVLARGKGWLAVDKPAGTAVHPLVEDERGTLLNALIARHPEVQDVGEGGLRSGVVHRLDVDTSGVLLFAIREDRWLSLRAAFTEQRVDKRYRAIVLGRPNEIGHIKVGLVTARHRPARVRVVGREETARGVRAGELSWKVLERFETASLVEVRPVTGFLHQIRVIFAHLGHPIAGDRVYGRNDDPVGAPRQMLHAASVNIGDVSAESADPEDFAAVCARLRAEVRGESGP